MKVEGWCKGFRVGLGLWGREGLWGFRVGLGLWGAEGLWGFRVLGV